MQRQEEEKRQQLLQRMTAQDQQRKGKQQPKSQTQDGEKLDEQPTDPNAGTKVIQARWKRRGEKRKGSQLPNYSKHRRRSSKLAKLVKLESLTSMWYSSSSRVRKRNPQGNGRKLKRQRGKRR